jgi:RNA polymerase sigma-70 factor (sigma-E family)
MSTNGGDRFASYIMTMRPRLRRQAHALCGDWDEADDVVQDTLLKMYLRWPRLKRQGDLNGYIRRVLVRTYLDHRRLARWHMEVSQADVPDQVARQGSVVEDHQVVMAALRQLGSRQRAAVVLRYCEDLSVEQVAALMGCSPGTVTSQTHRALTALRAIAGDLERP